jgi:hypothetical protein
MSADDPFTEDLRASAGAEASRLAAVVRALEDRLAVARAERALLAEWTEEQVADLRTGMRMPRFADVGGVGAELAEARAQLEAVSALRRGLGAPPQEP